MADLSRDAAGGLPWLRIAGVLALEDLEQQRHQHVALRRIRPPRARDERTGDGVRLRVVFGSRVFGDLPTEERLLRIADRGRCRRCRVGRDRGCFRFRFCGLLFRGRFLRGLRLARQEPEQEHEEDPSPPTTAP